MLPRQIDIDSMGTDLVSRRIQVHAHACWLFECRTIMEFHSYRYTENSMLE